MAYRCKPPTGSASSSSITRAPAQHLALYAESGAWTVCSVGGGALADICRARAGCQPLVGGIYALPYGDTPRVSSHYARVVPGGVRLLCKSPPAGFRITKSSVGALVLHLPSPLEGGVRTERRLRGGAATCPCRARACRQPVGGGDMLSLMGDTPEQLCFGDVWSPGGVRLAYASPLPGSTSCRTGSERSSCSSTSLRRRERGLRAAS